MNFGNTHYVPFLKGKMGEYTALSKLSSDTVKRLTPLIDIPPISTHGSTAKTMQNHLDSNVEKLVKHWGPDKPLFVDLHDIDVETRLPGGKHHVEYFHAVLRQKRINAIPVSGLDRDEPYQDVVSLALRTTGQVAIRLLPEDLAAPSLLEDELRDLRRKLAVKRNMVHLMFDLRSLQLTSSVAQAVSACRGATTAIKALNTYATLTVIGSSMPQSLSELVSANDTGRIPRLEVEVWRRLQSTAGRKPSFGDYGAVHPDVLDLDPKKITLAADIRYTCPSDTLVLRGSSIKRHPKGFGQYHDLARALVNLPDYQGRGFSWGDEAIFQKAHRLTPKPGNKTTWVQIATNHHIELVTATLRRQLEAA